MRRLPWPAVVALVVLAVVVLVVRVLALVIALVVDLVARVADTIGTVAGGAADLVERAESAAAGWCGVLPLAPRVIVTPPAGGVR
jgi:hypothetical protein